MNKKKLLAMLVSLCLVAALGVGATLALFSDTTNKLTNTFTVGGGITAHLEEVTDRDDITGEETKGTTGEDDEKEYQNTMPGATVIKEPYMVIEANSSNCYSLVQVTGIEELEALNNGLSFTVGAFNTLGIEAGKSGSHTNALGYKWEKLADADKAAATTAKDGIYILVDAQGKPVVINTNAAAQYTINLFNEVKLDNMDTDQLAALKTALTSNTGIKLVGCAIQADNAQEVADENGVTLKEQLLDEAKFAETATPDVE